MKNVNNLFKILMTTSLVMGGNLSLAEGGMSIDDIKNFFSNSISSGSGSSDNELSPTSGKEAVKILQQKIMGADIELVETQYMFFNYYVFTEDQVDSFQLKPHEKPGISVSDYLVLESNNSNGTLCSKDKVYVISEDLVDDEESLNMSWAFSKDIMNDHYFPKSASQRPLMLHDFAAHGLKTLSTKPYDQMDVTDKENLVDLIILANLAKAYKAIYAGNEDMLKQALYNTKNACSDTSLQQAQLKLLSRDKDLVVNAIHKMQSNVDIMAKRNEYPAPFSSIELSKAATFIAFLADIPLPESGYVQMWIADEENLSFVKPTEDAEPSGYLVADDSLISPDMSSCANLGFTYLVNPEETDKGAAVILVETSDINPEAKTSRELFKAAEDQNSKPLVDVFSTMIKVNQILQRLATTKNLELTNEEEIRLIQGFLTAQAFSLALEVVKIEDDAQREKALNFLGNSFTSVCDPEKGPQYAKTMLSQILGIQTAPTAEETSQAADAAPQAEQQSTTEAAPSAASNQGESAESMEAPGAAVSGG